jgi:MerR family transcriptional regulator, light-induced transcriptional regulator
VLDGSAARRLRSTALAMAAIQCVLAEAIDDAGVLVAWDNVIEPVLTALGVRRHGSRTGADAEWLLTECALAVLVRATPSWRLLATSAQCFSSGVPAEHANLPLYALNACPARRRIGTQLFGTPPSAGVLAAAVRYGAPAVVVVRAQRDAVADANLFSRVTLGRQRGRVFAWGPGWARAALPRKVELLSDLRTAADRIECVLLGE